MSGHDSDDDAYSWDTFDKVLMRIAQLTRPTTVLDIGAGSGKYGELFREVATKARLTGIEIDTEVAERNGLAKIYDEVLNLDAIDAMAQLSHREFDLCIIGDCIEHMRKTEGLDLLNFLTYRCKYILIIAPEAMKMNLKPFYRGHNSVWTARDFHWHDNWAVGRVVIQQLFVLRGYLQAEVPLLQLCETINREAFEIATPDHKAILHLVHTDQRTLIDVNGTPSTFRYG
jgi:SAM-dependent methyltransferase